MGLFQIRMGRARGQKSFGQKAVSFIGVTPTIQVKGRDELGDGEKTGWGAKLNFAKSRSLH